MQQNQLKGTNLTVSALCLGTGTFGGRGVYKQSGDVSQKDANEIVGFALDNGINLIDTAEIYSSGWSEYMLGKALGQRRKEAVIITKVAPEKTDAFPDGELSRNRIISGCEASLKRLGTDYIDIYELHSPSNETPLVETMEALNSLVQTGKVRYIGCSNFPAWKIVKANNIAKQNGWASFISLEAKYSLMSRELEYELIPACCDEAINVFCFSPLYGGFLSGKYSRNKPWPEGTRFPSRRDTGRWPVDIDKLFTIVDAMKLIGEHHGVPVSHVALKYLLYKRPISSLNIGTRRISQLKVNISATDWEMEADEIAMLDSIS
ncbi:MAG: aldo/keto reductase, partial [Lachnospiraceae bacterium]|nr:aldo/keto reductase [Lachnospiraceae bacterium]